MEDMSSNFFAFPSEIRNKIYELVLLHQEPIDPWVTWYRPQKLTPGLFRTNKTVHYEAASLFYAQNRFDFTACTPEGITSFLEQIGRNNASYIRRIYVDFPIFRYLDPGDVALEDDSIRILAKIRNDCVNLSSLTTSLYSTSAMEFRLVALDYPKIVSEALKLVDTRFRAISSLQEIVVEVYEDGPSDHLRREMKTLGWNISATPHVEESVSDWSFVYDEEYDFQYYDDGYDFQYHDDGYDIDNDSDFWRRAGD